MSICREELISIKDAPKHIPGRPAKSTVWRWVLSGVGGRKLETIKVGGKRFTSRQAIKRFVHSHTGTVQSHTESSADDRRAAAELDQAGW